MTERLTDPGNLATPGIPLLRIESDGVRQVVARVDEARAAYVHSGDRVRVTVFGQPELTGEYAIDGGGQMSYPLIGQIRAGGLTAAELEKDLIGKLSPGYLKDPSVSVEVLTYRPFYIVGEVRTPGSYPFVNGMTVLNAVALAGGFTYRADKKNVWIKHNGETTEQKSELTPSTVVAPGDTIRLGERFF